MTGAFGLVMLQALYYGIVGVLTLFFCGVFLRGFFVNYFKVRTSFGKLVMVKVRSPLRDYFARGWVEEGFLVYKHNKDVIRLNIPQDVNPFYKCIAVTWVDVDDEKLAIAKTNYSTVTGYDAVKNNNLHTRALMRPNIVSGKEKLLLFLVVIVGVIALAGVYMAYNSYAGVTQLQADLPGLLKNLAGTVTGGRTI